MSEYFYHNRLRANKIAGLCYSGFRDGQNPVTKIYPTADQVRDDFKLIKNCKRIRIYSMHHPFDISEIAEEFGLEVNQGVWIDSFEFRNKEEIKRAVRSCNTFSSIRSVTVGNEMVWQKLVSPKKLIGYIREVKKQVSVPVSTAETYKSWLQFPELADEVDFLAVSVFPYWEGESIDNALSLIESAVGLLQSRYPDKEVIIYDNGWPSGGQVIKKAVPSIENQKRYVDEFTTFCHKNKLKYFLFEAFDEEWKRMVEKEVGTHWGIYDRDRVAKL